MGHPVCYTPPMNDSTQSHESIGGSETTKRNGPVAAVNGALSRFREKHGRTVAAAAVVAVGISRVLDRAARDDAGAFVEKYGPVEAGGSHGTISAELSFNLGALHDGELSATVEVRDGESRLEGVVCEFGLLDGDASALACGLSTRGFATDGALKAFKSALDSAGAAAARRLDEMRSFLDGIQGRLKIPGAERRKLFQALGRSHLSVRAAELYPAAERALARLERFAAERTADMRHAIRVLSFFAGSDKAAGIRERFTVECRRDGWDGPARLYMNSGTVEMMLDLNGMGGRKNCADISHVREKAVRFLSYPYVADGSAGCIPEAVAELIVLMDSVAQKGIAEAAALLDAAKAEFGVDGEPSSAFKAVRNALKDRNLPKEDAERAARAALERLDIGDDMIHAAYAREHLSELLDVVDRYGNLKKAGCCREVVAEAVNGRYRARVTLPLEMPDEIEIYGTVEVEDTALKLTRTASDVNLDDRDYDPWKLCEELKGGGLANEEAFAAVGAALAKVAGELDAVMAGFSAELDAMAGERLEGDVSWKCRKVVEMGVDPFTKRAERLRPDAERALERLESAARSGFKDITLDWSEHSVGEFELEVKRDGWHFTLMVTALFDEDDDDFDLWFLSEFEAETAFATKARDEIMRLLAAHDVTDDDAVDIVEAVALAADKLDALADEARAARASNAEGGAALDATPIQ